MILQAIAPFDFQRTLRFILSPPAMVNGKEFAPLLDYFRDGEYRRAVEIDGHRVLYGLRDAQETGASGQPSPTLKIRILSGPKDSTLLARVADLARRQFALHVDLSPFYQLASQDPALSHLVRRFQGMRIPQSPTVFETVICAIIEQQVNLTFAHKVKLALIQKMGERVDFEGRNYNCFPSAKVLAQATPRGLLELQVSGPKARYIISIARAVAEGSLELESLGGLEPAIAYEKLIALKGVGPWTVQYVGLRALGHLNCLPAADVGLQKSVRNFYSLRKPLSLARLQKLARAWRGWESYATFYLWLTYWETTEWKQQLREEIRNFRRSRKIRTEGSA